MTSCQVKASRESSVSGMLLDYCCASVKNRTGMFWDFVSIRRKSSVQASFASAGTHSHRSALLPPALVAPCGACSSSHPQLPAGCRCHSSCGLAQLPDVLTAAWAEPELCRESLTGHLGMEWGRFLGSVALQTEQQHLCRDPLLHPRSGRIPG